VSGLPLRSASLLLRHFVVGDAPAVLQLNAEPSTRHWLPSHVYANLAKAAEALEYLIASYSQPGDPRRGPYVLAVELARTHRLLGHVGFSPLDRDVEVSYSIAESERGRGFGAEALASACRWASPAFGLHSLIAITAVENVASRRMLERASFLHEWEGTMRFQGDRRAVSRYRWRPGAGDAGVP
jgi:RimJ/RimL family protein N-acetyltransferase